MRWRLLSVVVLFAAVATIDAQEDGVYQVTPKGGVGSSITLTVLRGHISSESNSNDRWNLFVCYPRTEFLPGHRYCVFLDGVRKSVNSWGRADETSYNFSLALTASEAQRASIVFGIPLSARTHPGHRIDATFSSEKRVYRSGESVVVMMKIRNLAETPFHFRQGGHQRGPRDDQFRFFGSGPQGTLPVKEATNFGGIVRVITIPPNEEVLLGVELNAWFDLEMPGSYDLFGSYLLPICKSETFTHPADWEDYIVRPFSFEVREKK